MLKAKVLLWRRAGTRSKPMPWSPFFTTPERTEALLKPLFEFPDAQQVTIHSETTVKSQYPRIKLLLWLLVLIAAIRLSSGQTAFAINPSGNTMSGLRSEALEAEGNGEFDKAESLYQKALTAAQQSDSKTKVVEFLSRIVQVRIESHKLLQTDALVQEAIQLAQSLKNTHGGDSTLPVWMNDMADAFYSYGEHTTNEDTKEYCLKHYIDIKLTVTDTWDPQLMCKLNLLTSGLSTVGKYLEAVPYVEKATAYLEKMQSKERANIAWQYFVLGTHYSAANFLDRADSTFQKSLQLQAAAGNTKGFGGATAMEFGTLAMARGNLEAARHLFTQAISIDQTDIRTVALNEFALGVVEQRASNLDAASHYYQASLHHHDQAPRPALNILNPGGFDSLVVIAAEHLVQVLERSHKNMTVISSLKDRAIKLRSQHPEWNTKNPESEKYFLTWWSLPFHVDIIPTRSVVPL